MSSSTVSDAFGDMSLYDILGVARDAGASQIKKAYFKAALKWHPDKCKDDDAKGKFQALSIAHATLSDPEKRKVYDTTGVVEDDGGLTESGREWTKYWRAAFPRVEVSDIESFSKTYRFSDEEAEDVLKAYTLCEGDLDVAMEGHIMLCEESDQERFTKIIKDAIASGKVEPLGAWKKGGKDASKKHRSKGKGKGKDKVKKARKPRDESKEAEALAAELGLGGAGGGGGGGGPEALIMAIRSKRRGGDILSSIANKYESKSKRTRKPKKKPAFVEPSDEEFARIQASLKR